MRAVQDVHGVGTGILNPSALLEHALGIPALGGGDSHAGDEDAVRELASPLGALLQGNLRLDVEGLRRAAAHCHPGDGRLRTGHHRPDLPDVLRAGSAAAAHEAGSRLDHPSGVLCHVLGLAR